MKKIVLAIVLLGLCKPILSNDVLSNNAQRKQAANQFLKTEDPKIREAMLPIIRKDLEGKQISLNRWIIGGAGCVVLGMVCAYVAYKNVDNCPCFMPGLVASIGLSSSSLIQTIGDILHKRALSNFIKNRLDKKNKTSLDWYYIQKEGRSRLFNSHTFWNSTSAKSEDVFVETEPCEIYNKNTKEVLSWNMNDSEFVKKVYANEYNADKWMFRKTKAKSEDI